MYQPVEMGNTGPPDPLQAGDVLYPMRVTLFIALLCMGYSMSQPEPRKRKEQNLFLPAATGREALEPELTGLTPWQRKASEKAVEKYATTQEKKWQRWNEAMFERST